MNTSLNINFTRITSTSPLSKAYRLDKNGTIQKTAAATMVSGRAERVTLPFAKFPEELAKSSSNQAFCYGSYPNHYPDTVKIATKGNEGTNNISRSLDYFCYSGTGILMIDHDPSSFGQVIKPEQLLKILKGIHPELAKAAVIIRGSVSAGVHAVDEKPLTDKGFHVYIPVKNAADIPRYGALLSDWLWLKGYGFIALSASGALLERTIIDGSVFSPERLDFVGKPIVKGVSYTPPVTTYIDGDLLNTESLFDLTVAQKDRVVHLKSEAKAVIKPKAVKQEKKWLKEKVKTLRAKGVDAKNAQALVKAIIKNGFKDLYGNFLLEFPTGTVSISEVLKNPLAYDSKALADPIEGSGYGKTTAKFFHNNGKPVINSFAHGTETVYFLHDSIDAPKKETGEMGVQFYLIKSAPMSELACILDKTCFFAAHHLIHSVPEFMTIYRRIYDEARSRGFADLKLIGKQLRYHLKNRIQTLKGSVSVTRDLPCLEGNNDELAMQIRAIYEAGGGVIIDQRGMGTGKTELMIKLSDHYRGLVTHSEIKQHHFDHGGTESEWNIINNDPRKFTELQVKLRKPSFLKMDVVTHRISIAVANASRFDYLCYRDMPKGYGGNQVATCVNSIRHYPNNPDIRFIDEARQLFDHVFTGPCKDRVDVHQALTDGLKTTRLTLLADADFDDGTLAYLRTITDKPIYLIRDNTPRKGKTLQVLGNADATRQHAKQAILEGHNIYMPSDSARQCRYNEKYLIDEAGLKPEEILLVTRKTKDMPRQAAFLNSPNSESRKYRVVICSPTVSSSISITNGHFTRVYGTFLNVVTAPVVHQMLGRIRTVNDPFVSYTACYTKNRLTELKAIRDGETNKKGRWCEESGSIVFSDFEIRELKIRAERNKSLNAGFGDVKLMAYINGGRVVFCDQSHAKIEGLADSVKAICEDEILNAAPITETEARAIEISTCIREDQHNSLDRHAVVKMSGKKVDEITRDDVEFYHKQGLKIMGRLESLYTKTSDLIDSDRAAPEKKRSKTSEKFMLVSVLTLLVGSTEGTTYELSNILRQLANKKIDKALAIKACQFLVKNRKELAVNGLGNYPALSQRPMRQLSDFLGKFGFELLEATKTKRGDRTYVVEINPLAEAYLKNRAGLRKEVGDSTDVSFIALDFSSDTLKATDYVTSNA